MMNAREVVPLVRRGSELSNARIVRAVAPGISAKADQSNRFDMPVEKHDMAPIFSPHGVEIADGFIGHGGCFRRIQNAVTTSPAR